MRMMKNKPVYNLAVSFLLLTLPLVLTKNHIVLTEKNHVSIHGPIDSHSANHFFQQIAQVDSDGYIYINSQGGSVVAGNRIVRHVKSKNYTCIADKAMSMAFVILQSCAHRLVMHGSMLMQHQQYLEIEGNLENIKGYLHMVTTMEEEMTNMQAARLNMSIHEFKTRTNTDWWLYGDEIVTYGAADDIIESIECDKKLYEKQYTRKRNLGFFGMKVNVTYSGCPLVESESE
jgi:ATP-dependent protease ClpP protease subunit